MSDTFRTLDTNCNMIRIGDEMAQVLTDAGISVVHDRSLYDYPSYSGAYNRSLASIESYLQKYPSISFVLDVHRDAVQDANGQQFKLLCGEDKNAAQLEFVIGSNGGGLSHDLWRENLKLACAVQETLYKDYPTLMRPVTVRNSARATTSTRRRARFSSRSARRAIRSKKPSTPRGFLPRALPKRYKTGRNGAPAAKIDGKRQKAQILVKVAVLHSAQKSC